MMSCNAERKRKKNGFFFFFPWLKLVVFFSYLYQVREQYSEVRSDPPTPTSTTATCKGLKSQPQTPNKVTITSLLDEDDSSPPSLHRSSVCHIPQSGITQSSVAPSNGTKSVIKQAMAGHVGNKIQVKPGPPQLPGVLAQLNAGHGLPTPINLSHGANEPVNMSHNVAEPINMGEGFNLPINLTQCPMNLTQNIQGQGQNVSRQVTIDSQGQVNVRQPSLIQLNQVQTNLGLINSLTSPATTPFTSPLNSPRVMNPLVNAFNLGNVTTCSAVGTGTPVQTVVQTTTPTQYVVMPQQTLTAVDTQHKLIIVSPQSVTQPTGTTNMQTILQVPTLLQQPIKIENSSPVTSQIPQALVQQQVCLLIPGFFTCM